MNDDLWELRKANKARADEVRAELAERQVQCIHRDDGHLTEWSVNMPKKPQPPTLDILLYAEGIAVRHKDTTAGCNVP